MGRLSILVLLAGFSCALGQPVASNVWDALGQLNCSRLQAAIAAAGLKATLQAPSLQVIFLAPTDAAFSSDEAALTALFPSGPNNNLFYNMLPPAVPLGQFGTTDEQTFSSQYPLDAQATSSVTIRVLSTTTGDALAAGVAPGARLNTQRYYTAGQSTIYLLDNVLVPPSLRFLNPTTGTRNLLGLAINQALTTPELQPYWIWTTLIAADPELTARLSKQDQAVTLFIPLNSAMQRYFACQGTTLPQFKGTPAAKALVLGHLLPGQPYLLKNFPASGQLRSEITYVAITSDGTGNAVTAGGKSVISDYSNIRAGKSVLHIIDGVISNNPCINSVPSPISTGVVATPPTAVPPPEEVASSGGSDGPNLAMIGGVVAAGVIGLILIGVLIAFIVFRKRKTAHKQDRERLTRGGSSRNQGSRRALDGHAQLYVNAPLYGRRGRSASARERASPAGGITKQPINVQGFMFGDQFVRCTAPQYSWIDIPVDKVVPGVEAGINDTTLDASLTSTGNSPIIRLTRADVVKQIRLLNSGLLGRGASALVFKCQWPSRFGPNALLAIKVLKDPYEADPSVYESFCYEAAVLASVRHPNVVKMYGFCLELPTACIIMELCPGTLKDRLYRRVPGACSRSASATVTGVAPTAAPGPQARSGANLSPVTEATAAANKGLIDELIANPLGKGPLDKVAPANGSDPDAVALVAAAPGTLPLPQSDSANGAPQPTVTVSVSPPTSAAPQRSRSVARSNVSLPHGLTANGDRPTSGPVNQGYPIQYNSLSMAEVLLLAADVAAGLAYLHRRPAIMALPMHPTLMLEAATGETGSDPMSATNSQTTVTHVGPAIATAAAEVEEDQGEEEDEGKAVARIVHRDLKPSNILVNSHSRCKISDFGLARWHSNTTVHTGTLGVGTLRYMAPELLLGHYSGRGPEADPVTNRVDIYSLGMLCYEMATSQMPWMDLTDAQIVAAVINQKRPNLEGQVSDAVEPEVDISDKDAIPALLKAQHIDEGTGRTPDLPDALSNFPALISIINSCWQQQDGRRPTARMVHKALCALAVSYGQNPEAGAAGQGSI